MITDLGFKKIGQSILDLIDKAIIIADGKEYEYDIYEKKITDENKLIITVYCQDEFFGIITEKYLIDKDKNKLIDSKIVFDKTDVDGVYIRFGIKLKEVLADE